jgi:DNA-binding transcriptional regulator GbsR (MarR family)
VLGDYRFSLAIRRLEALQFVENVEKKDDRGDSYTAIRPSTHGILWAHENNDSIEDAREEMRPGRRSGSDDIPF